MKTILGDCVETMAGMPSGSIDLVVTSPPYGKLRTYGGSYNYLFEGAAKQIFRLLKEGGVCCWIIGDEVEDGSENLLPFRQAIHFKDVCGFSVHDTMIYQKLNFSHPEKTRYHQVFEFVFILSKGKPATFNPIKDRQNITAGCVGNLGVNTFTERDGSKSVRAKKITSDFGMRHNVWKGKTRGQEDMCVKLPHPAMMPKWLARDLILSWSNKGETVLDPFLGSGTVGSEAGNTGRDFIGIEINPDYFSALKQPEPQLQFA